MHVDVGSVGFPATGAGTGVESWVVGTGLGMSLAGEGAASLGALLVGTGLGTIGALTSLGALATGGETAEGLVGTGLGTPVPGAGVSLGALLFGIGEGAFRATLTSATGGGAAELSAE